MSCLSTGRIRPVSTTSAPVEQVYAPADFERMGRLTQTVRELAAEDPTSTSGKICQQMADSLRPFTAHGGRAA